MKNTITTTASLAAAANQFGTVEERDFPTPETAPSAYVSEENTPAYLTVPFKAPLDAGEVYRHLNGDHVGQTGADILTRLAELIAGPGRYSQEFANYRRTLTGIIDASYNGLTRGFAIRGWRSENMNEGHTFAEKAHRACPGLQAINSNFHDFQERVGVIIYA